MLAGLPAHLASRVGVADTFAAINAHCGEHYTDCDIQPQGRGCNCHFEKASYARVHGPAIAAAARLLLARTNRSEEVAAAQCCCYKERLATR